MTKKTYDLAVKVGTYEKGGETKNRYLNIGAVLQKDDGGKFILLDRTFNPAGVPNPDGRSTVIVSLFEVKKEENHKDISKDEDVAVSNPADEETIPF